MGYACPERVKRLAHPTVRTTPATRWLIVARSPWFHQYAADIVAGDAALPLFPHDLLAELTFGPPGVGSLKTLSSKCAFESGLASVNEMLTSLYSVMRQTASTQACSRFQP